MTRAVPGIDDASAPADTAARFARQIVLSGVGVSGHRRLAAARYHFAGDPSIVEPAVIYVRAAGATRVTTAEDGHAVAGAATCQVTLDDDRIKDRVVEIGATARPGDCSVGPFPVRNPSPLADATDLKAAGMLLAIEALRAGLGERGPDSWGIGPKP